MNTAFSIIFENSEEISSLINISEKYFKLELTRQSNYNAVLASIEESYIIKISPKSMKFIIGENNEAEIKNKISKVQRFLEKNFANEELAIKYYTDKKYIIQNTESLKLVYLN